MTWFLLTLGFLLTPAAFSSELKQETKEVSNLELLPSAVHREALLEDMPFTSISLSETGEAWIAGKHSLWKWTPAIGGLKKMEIPSEGLARVISWTAGSAVFQTLKKVYMIWDQPVSIKEIYSGTKVALDLNPEGLLAIGSKQSFLITRELHSKMPMSTDLAGCEAISLGEKGQVFCRIKGEIFLASKDQAKMKLILKTKSEIKAFRAFGDSVVVVSDKAVWVIGTDGSLLKTVIPQNGKKIAASYLDTHNHAFLFSDKLFEVNQIGEKKKITTWLSAPGTKVVDDLSYKNGRIGLILDGFPYIFQLEQIRK